ncbi:hypothetical protein [Sulfitobacter pontiacus]|uniref:hypothetical protein n=1 Tax=Sulfitobacter pontiacus TaxID=60137 RepID=UPI0030EC5ECC
MSKRFENGYVALFVTCIFLLTCIGFTSVFFAFSKGYQSADQEHSTYYAERDDAEIRYSKCLNAATDLNGARDCINDSSTTSREAQRAEQNLNTQREMAQWAESMGWAAWLIGASTLIATIVGVRYVFLTLIATQVMADDTREIGEKQVAAAFAAIDVAQEANKAAALQFRAAFKPWISVELKGPFLSETAQIKMFEVGEVQRMVSLHAKTFIHCIGEIPVTIEDFDLRLGEGADWPYVQNPPPGFGAGTTDFFAILPSKSTIQLDPRLGITEHSISFNFIMLTPENRSTFMLQPPPVLGKIVYSDPMGVRYEHRFAFIASPVWGDSFKRYGGRQHNYEREMDD